jgi:hypothetical protein
VGWTLRTRERTIEGEVMAGGGAPRPFIVAGRGTSGRGRGKQPAVMALTPLMAERLDGGLRVELRGGIKVGNEDLAWHLEVGGRAAWGGRRR